MSVDGRAIDSFNAHHESQIVPQWTSYTPKLTSQGYGGSFDPTLVTYAKYMVLNRKLVLISVQINIIAKGSCNGYAAFSLPNNLPRDKSVYGFANFYGSDPTANGANPLPVSQGPSTALSCFATTHLLSGYDMVTIMYYDGFTSPWITGVTLDVSGFYGLN